MIRYNVINNSNRRLNYFLNTDDGNLSSREPIDGITVVEPSYPFTVSNAEAGGGADGAIRREVLADYITNDIQFARAAVNYIWEELMVEAFVRPSNAFDLDRLDPNNPPPEPWTIHPVDLAEGRFATSLLRASADTQFNPWVSLSNNIQYDTVSRVLGWQTRFRWILRPGNDIFFVYVGFRQ